MDEMCRRNCGSYEMWVVERECSVSDRREFTSFTSWELTCMVGRLLRWSLVEEIDRREGSSQGKYFVAEAVRRGGS